MLVEVWVSLFHTQIVAGLFWFPLSGNRSPKLQPLKKSGNIRP